MQWSDIPWRPGRRTLRQFGGLLVAGGATVMIVRQELRVPALIAGLAGALGLAWPRALGPLYVGWMVAVFPLAWLVSRLALALLFYGLVTPLGLLLRLAGRDALGRRRGWKRSTYWIERRDVNDPDRYLRQY